MNPENQKVLDEFCDRAEFPARGDEHLPLTIDRETARRLSKLIRDMQENLEQLRPAPAARRQTHGEEHVLDVEHFEQARSLHRIVRAMHDGECPKCHTLHDARRMLQFDRPQVRCTQCGKTSAENRQKYCGDGSDKDNAHRWEPMPLPSPNAKLIAHICPQCGFRITAEESAAAMRAFSVVMGRNLAVFEEWRKNGYVQPNRENENNVESPIRPR